MECREKKKERMKERRLNLDPFVMTPTRKFNFQQLTSRKGEV